MKKYILRFLIINTCLSFQNEVRNLKCSFNKDFTSFTSCTWEREIKYLFILNNIRTPDAS